MMYPTMTVENKRYIGFANGEEMFAWDEVTEGGVRSFEQYPASVFLPSMGRDMGLVLVRETTKTA